MGELITGSSVDPDQSDGTESSYGNSSEEIETPEKTTPFDKLNQKVEELSGQLDASDWKYIFVKKKDEPEVIWVHVTSYTQSGMKNIIFIDDLWVSFHRWRKYIQTS